MAIYWYMGKDLQEALASARRALHGDKKIPIGISALLRELSKEIEKYTQQGDWETATRFSYFTHEIAKLHNCHIWFDVFLEVRKTRDMIALMSEEPNGKD